MDKIPAFGMTLKIASFEIEAEDSKAAYLKGCKKIAKFVASKKYKNLAMKVVNLGERKFCFILYTMLDITEEQSHFCKMCKEMHCSFYINEEYNCSRCNYKTFMKRMREKLTISKGFYREEIKK